MRARTLLATVAIPALIAASAACAAQPTTSTGSGQAFPDKPIRLIIGSAPGSGPDIMARLIADHLYGVWGQRVVVDTRPGVAGILSAENALRSERDGYTWLMLTSQLFIATSVYPDLKFNLDKDFDSMSLVGLVPWVLTINPQVPVVLSSGFAEQERLRSMLARGLRGFIPKPYTQQKLLTQIRSTLDALQAERTGERRVM